jgi:uncharacterized membrane protein
MLRQSLSTRPVIIAILFAQVIPLVLFPPKAFTGNTQEWWFPVILAFMALIGVFELVVRKSINNWPWYLMSFSQGFNIISRLMMFLPHTTVNVNGNQVLNTAYVVLSLISIILSALFLSYADWPEVRRGLS